MLKYNLSQTSKNLENFQQNSDFEITDSYIIYKKSLISGVKTLVLKLD